MGIEDVRPKKTERGINLMTTGLWRNWVQVLKPMGRLVVKGGSPITRVQIIMDTKRRGEKTGTSSTWVLMRS